MRTCPDCKAPLADGDLICPFCGKLLDASDTKASVTDNATAPADQPIFVTPLEPVEQPTASPTAPDLPMNWFKFLTVILFLGAAVNLISCISYLTGSLYGADKELVYSVFPDLQLVNTVYGLVMIALAAFCVFTRFQLTGFKKNGPMYLYCIYAANAILPLIYLAIASSIIQSEISLDVSSLSSIGTSVVMLIVNVVYFNKRKHMFVN